MADHNTHTTVIEMRKPRTVRTVNIRPVTTADLLSNLEGIVDVLRGRGPHALTAAREIVGLACRSAGGEDDSAVASVLLTVRTQPDLYTDEGRFRAEHAAFVLLDALTDIIALHDAGAQLCADADARQAALAETCARLLLKKASARTGLYCGAE